jgi:peptidoglycan/xylan/chitin deacetylase (PgdA/CDA1 family)
MKAILRRLQIIYTVGLLLTFFAASMMIPSRSQASDPVEATPDGSWRRLRVPVLMYHYVSVPPPDAGAIHQDLSVLPDNFRKQMRWLKDNNFTTITPDQLVGALRRGVKLPPRPVLLTFDDGYSDAYSIVFPTLKEFGFTGTFFLITGFIDEGRNGYLNWGQVKEMSQGGMSMQSHSRNHKDMRNRSSEWLVYEIVGPGETIEAHTGIRPRYFCYPSGGYDGYVIRELRAAGYFAAFTTNDGTFEYTDNMMRIPRIRMRQTTTMEQFAHLMEWVR